MSEKINYKTILENGVLRKVPFDYKAGQTDQLAAIRNDELAELEGMSREELVTLCRRFACQCGLAATMTDEETAQAMLDVLAETALKPVLYGTNMKADITSRLTAVERWLDRKKGKPVGTSPLIHLGAGGDLNVMIRLVDCAGNVEMIEG